MAKIRDTLNHCQVSGNRVGFTGLPSKNMDPLLNCFQPGIILCLENQLLVSVNGKSIRSLSLTGIEHEAKSDAVFKGALWAEEP